MVKSVDSILEVIGGYRGGCEELGYNVIRCFCPAPAVWWTSTPVLKDPERGYLTVLLERGDRPTAMGFPIGKHG